MSKDSRNLAALVVERVLRDKAFSKHALDSALKKQDLSPQETAFCTELVYGTLRWLPSLRDSLFRAMTKKNSKLPPDFEAHLLIAAYQLHHLEHSVPDYAAVNTAIKNIRRKKPGLAGFANAILRNLGSPIIQSGKALGFPDFFIKAFNILPENERLEAMLAMNSRPKTWYRNFGADLKPGSYQPHLFVPEAICFEKPPKPNDQLWVQDPASQIAALLVAPEPDDCLIDACAAPGSKTRILASHCKKVLAVDQDSKRLALVDQNIKKISGDFRELKLEPADKILLDAPCSGFGTIRRHPEIKLWRDWEDVERLVELQSELLEAAAKNLKPGGCLIYSVCTPIYEEGAGQIKRFLEKHPNFERQHAREILTWLPECTVNNLGEIQTWPHKDQCDAFFAARLIKR